MIIKLFISDFNLMLLFSCQILLWYSLVCTGLMKFGMCRLAIKKFYYIPIFLIHFLGDYWLQVSFKLFLYALKVDEMEAKT